MKAGKNLKEITDLLKQSAWTFDNCRITPIFLNIWRNIRVSVWDMVGSVRRSMSRQINGEFSDIISILRVISKNN